MPQLAEQNDEIYLVELFAVVKAYYWVVLVASTFAVAVTAQYVFSVATPEYQASTRFELLQGDSVGNRSFGDLSSIASVAGISIPSQGGEAEKLTDRILSRSFIESIYDRARFETDPVFNGFIREKGPVTRLLHAVFGAPPSILPTREDLVVSAIASLSLRMELKLGDNGIIELLLDHPNPERSAIVANLIVEQTLDDIFQRNRSEVRETMNYFAAELLQIRADLDDATEALQEFALNNDVQSSGLLAQASKQLSQLREEVESVNVNLSVLKVLQGTSRETFNPAEFASTYPVSRSVAFRRLVGWPSELTSWEKPAGDVISNAILQRTERLRSLKSNILELEERAKISGEQAFQLVKLEREVEVQRTVYESVITQFEARSLASGLEQASGRLIESAIPPYNPAKPRKFIALLLALIIGTVLGTLIALAIGLSRGFIFSRQQIQERLQIMEAAALSPISKWNRSNKPLRVREKRILQDVSVMIENSTKIAIINLGNAYLGSEIAYRLSEVFAKSEKKTAIVELGNNRPLLRDLDWKKSSHGFMRADASDSITVLAARHEDFIDEHRRLQEFLEDCSTKFDNVVLNCADVSTGMSSTILALNSSFDPVILCKRGSVKRALLDRVSNLLKQTLGSRPILLIE